MRFFAVILISSMLHGGSWCAIASADGGKLVMSKLYNDYRISVFTSPDPLRAGTADISVLLQNAESAQPIDDAQVYLKLTPRDSRAQSIVATATMDTATNKLLYAAFLELPAPGWWDVEISGSADGQPIQARFAIEVGEPLPRWLTVWPWFCWPAGLVLLFGVHRLRVSRQRRSNPRRSGNRPHASFGEVCA